MPDPVRTIEPAFAERIVEVRLETPFAGGRHERRVARIETASTQAEARSA
jgi:ribose 5-phosphate isomerase RpiB